MAKNKLSNRKQLENRASLAVSNMKQRLASQKVWGKRVVQFVDKRPIISFISLLGILLVLIIIGSFLSKPQQVEEEVASVKQVSVFTVGKTPQTTFQAQVEKTGIIQINAQVSGIIQKVDIVEGQIVEKGQQLVTLSSNYQGGTTATVQRQLASAQYQNVKDTYDLQKDLIGKQKEVANQTNENSDRLRKISDESEDDTQNLIDLNNTILGSLQSNLTTLQNSNTGGVNDSQILATRSQISQFQSVNNQLNASLQNIQYSTNTDNPPTKLTNLQKDIALKQLEIQEKALDLSLRVSGLQVQLAQIQESQYYPVAPFSGVVERVFVTPGESVTPGTPLLVVHGEQSLKAVVKVPQDIANQISKIEPSTLTINKNTFQTVPYYVSTDATDGQLYSVFYSLPDEYQNDITNMSFINVSIPLGNESQTTVVPYIPIDAVYQSQDSSYVYINSNGTVQTKEVTLGQVFGNFVQVDSGLKVNDQIIINRNVITGDKVTITQ